MVRHAIQTFALLVLAFVAVVPFQARAGSSTTFYRDITCANYVEAVEGNSNHSYELYIAGFLTGTNYLRSRTTPTDFSSYRVWVKNYCRENPFDLFLQALARLDHMLGEGEQRVEGAPAQKKNVKK